MGGKEKPSHHQNQNYLLGKEKERKEEEEEKGEEDDEKTKNELGGEVKEQRGGREARWRLGRHIENVSQ